METGINSRLDTIQAAVLLPKLKAFADYELKSVNRAADYYNKKLSGRIVTPHIPDGYYSSWAQYTVRFNDSETRNRIRQVLKEHGIPSMVYYPSGLHSQKAFQEINMPEEWFPNTVIASKTVLSLPIHPYLGMKEIDTVANVINEYI